VQSLIVFINVHLETQCFNALYAGEPVFIYFTASYATLLLYLMMMMMMMMSPNRLCGIAYWWSCRSFVHYEQ